MTSGFVSAARLAWAVGLMFVLGGMLASLSSAEELGPPVGIKRRISERGWTRRGSLARSTM